MNKTATTDTSVENDKMPLYCTLDFLYPNSYNLGQFYLDPTESEETKWEWRGKQEYRLKALLLLSNSLSASILATYDFKNQD